MADYKTLYFHLFNALTDVLLALEENNVDLAIKQIKNIQCAAEEMYITE